MQDLWLNLDSSYLKLCEYLATFPILEAMNKLREVQALCRGKSLPKQPSIIAAWLEQDKATRQTQEVLQ